MNAQFHSISIKKSWFALLAAFLLFGCTDDAIETAPGGSRLPLSLSVVQDWDTPTFSRPSAKAPSALENTYRTVGTLNGEPLFVYSTEVEGISAYDLRTSVKSGVDDDYSTRGVLKHSSSFHDNFNVYSSIADAGTTVMTPDGGTNWYLNRPLHWDGDNPATFYGVAPQGTYSGFTTVNPVITYVNPDTAVHQVDLMVSKATGKQSDAELPFPFHHILSAVKVKIGPTGLKNLTNDLKIVKLEIDGIYKQGTYNVESGTWTLNTSVTGKVTQQSGWEFSLVDKGVGENLMITNDVSGTTFLVVPQTLPSTAKLKVTFKKGSSAEQTVEASLTGTWQKGYTKTYVISSKDEYPGYVLEIENDSLSYKHNGNTVASGTTDRFRVKSYKNDISKTAVPWSITGYASGDGAFASTNSTFATAFSTTSGTGGQTGEVVSLSSVSAQVGRKEYHDFRRRVKLKALYQSEGTKGGDGAARFDLSAYQVDNKTKWPGDVLNTANCYIVRYPGKYKFPVVMGNSIVNSVFAPDRGSSTGAFVDYKDRYGYVTQSAFITNACPLPDAARAELVWEDSKGLVKVLNDGTNGNLYESTTIDGVPVRYIYFDVDSTTICQGNALICVKNSSGTIVWSWHIYVTDADWVSGMKEVKGVGANGFTYDMAPELLGYVVLEQRDFDYDPRHMRVQITQNTSNLTGNVKVQQLYFDTRFITPRSTLYQWGRKDPFPGMDSAWVNRNLSGTLITEQLIPDWGSNPGRLQAMSNDNYDLTYRTTPLRGLSKAGVSQYMTVGISIKNPFLFGRGEGESSSISWNYVNDNYDWNKDGRNGDYDKTKVLWDASNTLGKYNENYNTTRNYALVANRIRKTIYDPCPPGFNVAPSNAFFFTTKKEITNTSNLNTNSTETAYWNASSRYPYSDLKGFYIYTKPPLKTDSIYMPSCGQRQFWEGTLQQLGTYSNVHTANPFKDDCTIYYSHFKTRIATRGSTGLTTGSRMFRAWGISVWPMKGFLGTSSW